MRTLANIDSLRVDRLTELVVEVGARAHVCEHALQLRGVLVAAHLLETADHEALHIARDRLTMDETASKHLGVKLLEHVLVVHILEDQNLQDTC